MRKRAVCTNRSARTLNAQYRHRGREVATRWIATSLVAALAAGAATHVTAADIAGGKESEACATVGNPYDSGRSVSVFRSGGNSYWHRLGPRLGARVCGTAVADPDGVPSICVCTNTFYCRSSETFLIPDGGRYSIGDPTVPPLYACGYEFAAQ